MSSAWSPQPWDIEPVETVCKPVYKFKLTGSLKAQVENTYTSNEVPCFCITFDMHEEWCVYGKNNEKEGITREDLFSLEGWNLSKLCYDQAIYGGLSIPDRYEISHKCPVALWRMQISVEDKGIQPCRACCNSAPNELMAVYLLHRP